MLAPTRPLQAAMDRSFAERIALRSSPVVPWRAMVAAAVLALALGAVLSGGLAGERSSVAPPPRHAPALAVAGVLPFSRLSQTYDALAYNELLDARNLTHQFIEHIEAPKPTIQKELGHDGALGTIRALVCPPEQWQTRALFVICIAAVLRLDDGQNRDRLVGLLDALGAR